MPRSASWSTTFSNPVSATTDAAAGLAAGTGAANQPAVTLDVNAVLAEGFGTAYDATVLTVGAVTVTPGGRRPRILLPGRIERRIIPAVNVNAGLASGTGTAYDATVVTNDDDLAIALLFL